LTEAELNRAKRQIVAAEAFGRDGPYAIASQLNEAIAAGDWTLFTTYIDRIERVGLDDVQAAANHIFQRDTLTVGYYDPVLPVVDAS
jgi:zinc protease